MQGGKTNQMKTLYSKLNALVPRSSSKEMSSLPDQLDEAVIYIKELQARMEKLKKKKKESLLEPAESPSKTCPDGTTTSRAILSPEITIHGVGSTLDVVLITNSLGCDYLMFNEIVRVLEEEGAEIQNANFSVNGDIVFHSIHAEVADSAGNLSGAVATISKRLKELIPS